MVSTLLLTVMVALAVLLVGVRVVGLTPYTVLSGSMVPTYPVGAMIYVRAVAPQDIQVGTPLTFTLPGGTVATHRVHELVTVNGETQYITKGDANESEDGGLVHYKNVIGTPVFTIPYLGYVASYIQHPPGMYVAIAAGAVLLMLTFLPDVFAPDETGAGRPAAEEKKKRRVPAAETPAEEAPEIESRRSFAAEDTAKKAKRRARPAEGRHVRK